MKKGIIITLIALIGILQTQAQVTFKPGLRGGANFAHLTQGDAYTSYIYDANGNYVSTISKYDDFNSKTDFYVGFYGALHLTKYYTLQPEINYSRQGAKNFDVSYLSVGVINKFTFTDKFNVHLGTTLDFVAEKNLKTNSDLDLAFVLGTGYNFTSNFGIEGRIKKGIVPVNDYHSSHTNVVFSIGVAYTFDLK